LEALTLVSESEYDGAFPLVSIVIPTLNRKTHLKNCLNSIFAMNYPKSKLEVIVVDNGCTDGTENMLKENFVGVRLVFEKRRGVVYARNTGSVCARGFIIAYTDDDCIVDQEWVSALVSGFTSKAIGCVGGPVFHLHPELMPEKLWTYRTQPLYLGKRKHFVKVLISGNLAVRNEIFKRIRFDENLIFHEAEDSDFTTRIMGLGYKLLYVPNAIVYHDIDSKRSSMKYILRTAFFSGISLFIVERKRVKGVLIPQFLKSLLVGALLFFKHRKAADLYWLFACFTAFLSSIFFLPKKINDNIRYKAR
jgi:GT2 family glycosyltransferase